MLKAVKNHYNNKKTLRYQCRRHLEQYVFGVFMSVSCVLAMEIF